MNIWLMFINTRRFFSIDQEEFTFLPLWRLEGKPFPQDNVKLFFEKKQYLHLQRKVARKNSLDDIQTDFVSREIHRFSNRALTVIVSIVIDDDDEDDDDDDGDCDHGSAMLFWFV